MTELSDIGPPPELAWIPVELLFVDRRYQRTIESTASHKLIAQIVERFNWAAFQALLVTRRDDGSSGYWLIDGQHRVEAAKRRGISHLPSVVVSAASVADRAAAFVMANLSRVQVNPFALYRARLQANDPEAQAIDMLAVSCGIKIPASPTMVDRMKPGMTSAIGVFWRLPRKCGKEVADLAISAVADAYRDEAGGLRAVIFDAAAAVIARQPPPFEATAAAVTSALRRTTAAAFDDEAHGYKARYGGTVKSSAITVLSRRLNNEGHAARTPQQRVVPSVARTQAATEPSVAKRVKALKSDAPHRTPMSSVANDREQIEEYIRNKGVTRAPAAFVGEVTGAQPVPSDVAALQEHATALENRRQEQTAKRRKAWQGVPR